MVQYLIAYGVTAAVFFAIDLVWLTVVARRFYSDRLGEMLLARPNLAAAGLFYTAYVVGVVYFAVAPALRAGSISSALVNGALFGLFAYATYDMTNYATLKNWPLSVTAVDIAWGTGLTAVSALLGYLGTRLMMPA